MAKFIFEMPDDMAAAVEAHRIKRGHKATAIAVRELISGGLAAANKAAALELASQFIQEIVDSSIPEMVDYQHEARLVRARIDVALKECGA